MRASSRILWFVFYYYYIDSAAYERRTISDGDIIVCERNSHFSTGVGGVGPRVGAGERVVLMFLKLQRNRLQVENLCYGGAAELIIFDSIRDNEYFVWYSSPATRPEVEHYSGH